MDTRSTSKRKHIQENGFEYVLNPEGAELNPNLACLTCGKLHHAYYELTKPYAYHITLCLDCMWACTADWSHLHDYHSPGALSGPSNDGPHGQPHLGTVGSDSNAIGEESKDRCELLCLCS
jgi:hypothetical protein